VDVSWLRFEERVAPNIVRIVAKFVVDGLYGGRILLQICKERFITRLRESDESIENLRRTSAVVRGGEEIYSVKAPDHSLKTGVVLSKNERLTMMQGVLSIILPLRWAQTYWADEEVAHTRLTTRPPILWHTKTNGTCTNEALAKARQAIGWPTETRRFASPNHRRGLELCQQGARKVVNAED
jgi:hypothetical protein